MRSALRPILLAALLVTPLVASAQSVPEFACGTVEDESGGPTFGSDSSVVRALLVLVRFRNDVTTDGVKGWPGANRHTLPAFATTILAPTRAAITSSDSSLSRYFYEQSRLTSSSAGQLEYYGDVWPQDASGQPSVYVTKHDNDWYHSTSGRGYGYLTKEILDSLNTLPGFDIGNYDTNNDGVLDELMLLIRTEQARGDIGYSGCAWLDGCFPPVNGAPPGTLSYQSKANPSKWVSVDWYRSGTHQFSQEGDNVIPQYYYVRILAHEYGHHLFKAIHLDPIPNNGVPELTPSLPTPPLYKDVQNGYALMVGCCDPYTKGLITMSAIERALKGYVTVETLQGASGTHTIGDLYTAHKTYAIPLGGNRKVFLSNHQRRGFFDGFRYSASDNAFQGLNATGLLASYTEGSFTLDVLPPDNTLLNHVVRPNEPNHYKTDFYRPSTKTQLTPWTRPNINGTKQAPVGGSWGAIDDIRFTGAADSSMAFEFIADVRTASSFSIRADSWIGQETAGETIGANLSIKRGVTLNVDLSPTHEAEFSGTFIAEPGASVVLGSDATATSGTQRLVFRQGFSVPLGATLSIRKGTRLDFGSAAAPPAPPSNLLSEDLSLVLTGASSSRRARERRQTRAPLPPAAPSVSPSGERLRLSLAPNPVRGTVRVAFAVGASGVVRLSVHDALGREVARVHEGMMAAGAHAPSVDVSSWAPGVYVVRLAAGGAVQTARLVVTR